MEVCFWRMLLRLLCGRGLTRLSLVRLRLIYEREQAPLYHQEIVDCGLENVSRKDED